MLLHHKYVWWCTQGPDSKKNENRKQNYRELLNIVNKSRHIFSASDSLLRVALQEYLFDLPAVNSGMENCHMIC